MRDCDQNPQLRPLLHLATEEEIKSSEPEMTICWGTSISPFGNLFVARTKRGIIQLSFFEDEPTEAQQMMRSDWPNALRSRDNTMAQEISSQTFSRRTPQERPQLHIKGTDFQIAVWRALVDIPAGTLSTYGRIAHQLGRPGAARAVGNAVSKNRIAFLLPCHRVVRENGEIGDFRWGTERKRQMIKAEHTFEA